jgi:hypothetical protein
MSYDEAPNQPNDDASSLQARRARLRGSLAKQAIPPDPYKPDPYMNAGQDPETDPVNKDPAAVQQAANQGSQQPPGETVSDKKENQSNNNSPGGNGQGQPQASPLFITSPSTSSPFITETEDRQPVGGSSPFSSDAAQSAASSLFTRDPQSAIAKSPFSQDPASSPFSQDPGNSAISPYTQSPEYTPPPVSKNASSSFVSAIGLIEPRPPRPDLSGSTSGPQAQLAAPSAAAKVAPNAAPNPAPNPAQNPAPNPAAPGQTDSPFITQASSGSSAMSTLSDSLANLRSTNSAPVEAYKNAVTADEESEENTNKDRRTQKTIKESTKTFKEEEIPDDQFQAPAVIPPNDPGKTSVTVQSIHLQDPLANSSAAQVQVIELLNNMDQAMGACAMNLSALQKAAGEQTEALRSLTETLQHQTFSELGLNLTSLMESLSAALEPMKAVGELVPAIDQLVAVMEAKVVSEEPIIRVSPDHLLISLADQLGAGVIDPWTFKSAYMAVFPDDHPPELMHRLVELLGAQRLTGDLFRSAYDAVQAPDPPERARSGHATAGGEKEIIEIEKEVIKVVQDEAMLQQLEQLKRSQETFEVKMKQRENEFADMLGAKEQELQEAQELLNSRWEEFNARYDELTESLQKRDEVIQAKDGEISRKESENVQLRAQMEELREMMTELQKQFSGKAKEDSQKNAAGFFDTAPGAQAQQAQSPSLFDAAPSKPLFQTPGEPLQGGGQAQPISQNPSMVNQNIQAQMPQPAPQAPPQQQQPAQPQPVPQPMPQPVAQAAPSSQAVPRQAQATTPFAGAGPGSYGSGVRAQVFEVIVRQALAGAPWREICAGPMQVNNISPDEVEAEVKRRQALLGKK